MAANAIDLTTAAIVAADLGIASDATVERVVTAASRAIARYCGRSFEKKTGITEYPVSFGRPQLLLARPPILTITSITELGTVVDATEYEAVGVNAEAGVVYRKGGTGVWTDLVRVGGNITNAGDLHEGQAGDDGVTVVYDGGYVTPGQVALALFTPQTLPEDVQEACNVVAAAIYRSRGIDPRVASESIGDWSVAYAGFNSAIGRSTWFPEMAQTLLAPYRLIRVS